MRNKKYILISFLLMLVPFIIGAIFYNKMPAELPTHFGLDNTPDKYDSKLEALFFMPVIMTLLHALMIFKLNKDPRKRYQSERMYSFSLFIIPAMSILISIITVYYGLGKELNVGQIVLIAVSILIIISGNLMPKSKRNYTIGIKNQWTLSSDYVWEKTHRVAGFTFVVSGIISLISGIFFSQVNHMIPFISIIIGAAIPSVYSYFLYEKENERRD